MLTAFFNCLEAGLKITLVVHGVKYPEDVNPHFGGMIHKGSDHIVGVVAVAHQVLSSEQHHEGGIGHQPFKDARSLPGVFIEESGGNIKGGTTPDLHGIEPCFVHLLGDAFHILSSHSRCQ